MLREAGREAVETDAVEGCDVVIDALFGTGFHGAPRPDATAMIERINACGLPVVSVDLPSGVDASTGEVAGAAVNASLTVTFHASKVGLHVAPGRFHAGEVVVADIGLLPVETAVRRATPVLLQQVPIRGARDSKFTAGAVLVVGGAPGTTGAPVLAAMAALRADAGYVTVAVPRECLAAVEVLALEPVKRGFDWDDAEETIMAEAGRADAVALGPGLGRSPEAHALVARLLERLEVPVVVDADALFGLEPVARTHPTVLTPACRRARPPARPRLGLGRRPPARGGAGVRGALRRRRRAEGGRHDRAGADGRARRLRHRAAVARDGGHRRRADRRRGGVPRQGARPGHRRGCGRDGRTGSPPPSRRTRPGSSRATCSRSCRGRYREPMRRGTRDRSPMSRRRMLQLPLTALCVLATSCGGGGPGAAAEPPATSTSPFCRGKTGGALTMAPFRKESPQ